MKTLTLTSEGKTNDDLVIALQEVIRLIHEGFNSGFNGNDTGSFTFAIKEAL